MSDDGKHFALSEVLEEEKITIGKLRNPESQVKPTDFWALCLSGGGIRSAAFCLGVIQGLAKIGLLKHFDYLSTVSGGGYIGGWLSARIHRAKCKSKVWPDEVLEELRGDASKAGPPESEVGNQETGDRRPEPEAIRMLRDYSRFVAPEAGDWFSAAAIYLRNLMLNWCVLLPALAALMLLPWLYHWFVMFAHGWQEPLRLALPLLALVLSLIATCYGAWSSQQETAVGEEGLDGKGGFVWIRLVPLIASATLYSAWRYRGADEPSGSIWAAGLIIAGALGVLFFAASCTSIRDSRAPSRGPDGGPSFLTILVSFASAVGALALAVGSFEWLVRALSSTAVKPHGALWGMLAGPVLLAFYHIAQTLFAGLSSHLSGDADREWWARSAGWIVGSALAWAALAAAAFGVPHVAAFLEKAVLQNWDGWDQVLYTAITAVGGWVVALAGRSARTSSGFNAAEGEGGTLLTYVAGLGAPLFLTLLALGLAHANYAFLGRIADPDPCKWMEHTVPAEGGAVWGLFGIYLGFVVAFGLTIDVNRFSLHGTYRNRLVRAFLGASVGEVRKRNPLTGFSGGDNLRLRQLKDQLPLHVVCGTVNLMRGKRLAWKERKATSFTFSPLHCGSWLPMLGYRNSERYGGPDGLSLGSAMAISGAAVSPNMGFYSNPTVCFVLAFFNLRLGWWAGNPNAQATSSRRGPGFAARELLMEMLGATDDEHGYVYLSDGGHFDNLGLYEMVGRGCRFILVVDAAGDDSNLAVALRKIRIDLGVEITMHGLGGLSHDKADRKATARWAWGEVDYSNLAWRRCNPSNNRVADDNNAKDNKGILLCVRPVLLKDGGESADVRDYAAQNVEFPYESILDQQFEESQFESYRRLGLHSVEIKELQDASGPTDKNGGLLGKLRQYFKSNKIGFPGDDDGVARLFDALEKEAANPAPTRFGRQ